MSIWKDKAGRTHVGIMVRGQRVHRILPPGSTQSDAKLVESQIRAAVKNTPTQVNIPGDPALSEIMAIYIAYADSLRSPKTAIHHANRFCPWADQYRASDAKKAVSHFVKDCTGVYAPATINWSLSTLKKGLSLAYESEITSVNHADKVKLLPVHNLRTTVLTVKQVKELASKLNDDARAAMWISLYTGCRRGEILKMKPDDISGDEITIHAGNTKTHKTRTIPIIPALRPWLDFLPLGNADGIKSSWRRATAGTEFHFHDLRRSCATMMIAAGVDLYVVSKLLGHSSTVVTQARYGHLQVDRIAAGLNKTFV